MSFLPSFNMPTHSTSHRMMLLQKLGNGEIEVLLSEQEAEAPKAQKAFLICRTCRHPITSLEHAIAMAGHHRHLFTNPTGIQFEIGCFSLANGCVNYGQAMAQHSWFANYQWQFALCANCYTHIGWHYLPIAPGPNFYGLVLAHLVEAQSD